MSHLAQAPDGEAVAVAAPPWFPDQDDIDLLWHIGLFSADDARALRKVWRILKGQTDDYLDRLLGMVAAYPALATELAVLHGGRQQRETIDDSATLRRWFRQWLFETCLFPQEPPGSGKSMRIHRSTQNHRCSDFATSLPWLFRWR